MRSLIDRVLRFIARFALLGWYQDIETENLDRIPDAGPVLIVSNHYAGFLDPALLMAMLPRPPRFLAMATLWKNPFLWPLLKLADAIPVHRASEGSTASNVKTFASCHRELAKGAMIAIFPEGVAHDKLRLMPVRTGAARIVLGAREQGIEGIRIVPAGLVYEQKDAVRSRALVEVGQAIDLDAEIGRFVLPGEPGGEENHLAVERLTEEIRERLRSASPDFDSWSERAVYRRAADVALRPLDADPRWTVPFAEREDLAQGIARAPKARQEAVANAYARYETELHLVRLRDEQVVPGNTNERLRRYFRTAAAKILALAPFALIGLVANVVPGAIVWAMGRRHMAPVTRGTTKLLTAVVVFPLTWVGLFFLVRGNHFIIDWILVAFVGPICGFATLYAVERFRRYRRARVGRRSLRDHRALLGDIRERRARVVDAVTAATPEREIPIPLPAEG